GLLGRGERTGAPADRMQAVRARPCGADGEDRDARQSRGALVAHPGPVLQQLGHGPADAEAAVGRGDEGAEMELGPGAVGPMEVRAYVEMAERVLQCVEPGLDQLVEMRGAVVVTFDVRCGGRRCRAREDRLEASTEPATRPALPASGGDGVG